MGGITTNPLKILIVDDDEDMAYLLAKKLVSMGHEVKEASSRKFALHVLKEFQPDVVLLDVFLVHESGLSLCKEIKSLCNCRIMLCSAVIKDEWSDFAKTYGAECLLMKPISMEVLEHKLEKREI